TRNAAEVLVSSTANPPRELAMLEPEDFAPHLRGSHYGSWPQPPVAERIARYIASICHWGTGSSRLRLLRYTQIPDAVCTVVARYFGVQPDGKDQKAREAARYYAKGSERKQPFVSDSEEKQRRATTELRWLAEHFISPEIAALERKYPYFAADRNPLDVPDRTVLPSP